MSWYYALNNQQQGPVELAELQELVEQGTLNQSTLVWSEGMTGWQPYREAVPQAAPVAASVAPTLPGSVVCAECGRAFAPDEVIRLGNRHVCAGCKPIAIQKLREGVVSESDSEMIRKAHINHEASVKSVGFLYFLGAGFLFLAGLANLIIPRRATPGLDIPLGPIFIVIAGVQLWAAVGLRQLKPWSRIPSGILSVLGLLAFPLGTVINAYILYLLFSKKGTMVFSEHYQQIIATTPHIKYRTSIVIWILLGLLIALTGIALTVFLFAPRR